MYVGAHNWIGGPRNCAPFPRSSRKGYALPIPTLSFSDLQRLTAPKAGRPCGPVAAPKGMGAVATSNPYPGTYSDVNCPTSCFLLGNGLDMSILGQECWPCHNLCPAGTGWDAAALACDAGGFIAPGLPAATGAPAGCPGLCTSVPFYSMLNPDLCAPCAAAGAAPDYTTWIIGGGLVLAAVALFGGRRR